MFQVDVTYASKRDSIGRLGGGATSCAKTWPTNAAAVIKLTAQHFEAQRPRESDWQLRRRGPPGAVVVRQELQRCESPEQVASFLLLGGFDAINVQALSHFLDRLASWYGS